MMMLKNGGNVASAAASSKTFAVKRLTSTPKAGKICNKPDVVANFGYIGK